MRGGPPVTRLALAFAGGAALGRLPGLPIPVLVLSTGLLALIDAWLRPGARRLPALVAVLAGFVAAAAHDRPCPTPPHGATVTVSGYFLAPTRGRGGGFQPLAEVGCRARPLTALTREETDAGVPVTVRGTWRMGTRGDVLLVTAVEASSGPTDRRATLVRWRGRLLERLDAMYGDRAPMVSALVLARKEGLDPELREAFARSGTAHLLAISGFHVGVVAGLVLAVLRSVRVARRPAGVVAGAVTWSYVALIGFPEAACRAAVILSAVALSRARGRPPARWGALASALLVLVAIEPGLVSSAGFQLSFAGAAGLVAWSGAWGSALARRTGGRLPRVMVDGVAAGAAATLATLPIVAWHFERVSVVGIPATLAASPVVTLLLPGALLSLAADAVHPAAGAFLAGGVDLGLGLLEGGTRWMARPEWVSVWIPRSWVGVAVAAGCAGAWMAKRMRARARARWLSTALVGAAGVVAWPVALSLQGRGTVEIVAFDVGQGDAVGVRTPAGRWLLVDAGPPAQGGTAVHPAVAELGRRGARRLEVLVLTHPDLDHFGGAAEVLRRFAVGAVLDPGRGAGKSDFIDLLETARARGVPWRAAWEGHRLGLDGVDVEVLNPGPSAGAEPLDANATSVVLLVRYGSFEALLTGDASVDVERRILPGLPGALEVLKVGHHGSTTSTAAELLEATHPSLALVSVGRSNRYGHPAPSVLDRLRDAGAQVRRTDQEGTIRVVGRRDGSFRVESARPRGR